MKHGTLLEKVPGQFLDNEGGHTWALWPKCLDWRSNLPLDLNALRLARSREAESWCRAGCLSIIFGLEKTNVTCISFFLFSMSTYFPWFTLTIQKL